MEEVKAKRIYAHEETSLGKFAALINGADKAKAYDIGIKLFRDENNGYLVLVNDILVPCDTEEELISATKQILFSVEAKHQQRIVPTITLKDKTNDHSEENFSFGSFNNDEDKINLTIMDGTNNEAQQVYKAKLEELLISGEPIEDKDVLANKLIELATVSIPYQGEVVEAIDFNIKRTI